MTSHFCNFPKLLNSVWMTVYKYLSSTDQPLQNTLHILVTYNNQGVWLSVPESKSAQSDWKLSDFFFFPLLIQKGTEGWEPFAQTKITSKGTFKLVLLWPVCSIPLLLTLLEKCQRSWDRWGTPQTSSVAMINGAELLSLPAMPLTFCHLYPYLWLIYGAR